ncbi:PucR family transcriptional regulator [Sediminivirga luteola]|uniref:PucR family transcriptional regulator n=1 Tax=Sediminivirga luteola TaxID=1774748 RepID=UPI001F565025|nr:PucR family transcriptional regulator [Sediminivirga luteola]MCI2265095.1 helix-turn-helix domain-containing protein [Sediminivirga luteola]
MTTLAELLHPPFWRERAQVLGAGGSVAPARVPVSHVRLVMAGGREDLESGDLLVVFGTTDQHWWWDALVRRVRDSGAAGIVVCSAHEAQAGGSAAALARRLGVALVVLEGSQQNLLEFAAQARVHLQAPRLRDADILTALQAAQGEQRPESMRPVLDQFSALIGADVWLGVENGPLLAHTEGVGTVPQEALARFDPGAALTARDEYLYVRQPFRVGKQRYLLGARLPADSPAEAVRQAERVVALGSVYAARWYAELQLAGQVLGSARNAVLDQAFAGTAPLSSLEQRAADLGLPLTGWHLTFFLAPADPVPGLGDVLEDALQIVRATTVLLPRDGGWAGWVQFSSAPSAVRLQEVVRDLRAVYRKTARGIEISMGIGRAGEGVDHLRQALAEARDAAQLAGTKAAGRRFVRADGLGATRLLLSWTESAPFLPQAVGLLEPLDDLGAEYRKTLLAYLDSSLSTAQAAKVLGTHRNTVRMRIDRIRETLGVDLASRDERLALHLALRATEHRPS